MRLLAGTKGSHIPYRESKLTRLLQPSLEGNAQVVLLATISPLAMAVAESESTLDFMAQAKRVTTHATVSASTAVWSVWGVPALTEGLSGVPTGTAA
ncbi:kinesin family-like protein, partial [Haematococcus lacustris]